MLGLQSATLENQARLFTNQIVQQKNEILFRELDFYNKAFNTVATAATLLAGFTYKALDLGEAEIRDDPIQRVFQLAFKSTATIGVLVNLLTLLEAIFVALFSFRMALRGERASVENAVLLVRGEYQRVLYMMIGAVQIFIVNVGLMGFHRFDGLLGFGMALMASIAFLTVFVLYRRAVETFAIPQDVNVVSAPNTRPSAVNSHEEIILRQDINLTPSRNPTGKTVAMAEPANAADGREQSAVRQDISLNASSSQAPAVRVETPPARRRSLIGRMLGSNELADIKTPLNKSGDADVV